MISVVIPNYNGVELLKKSVPRLLELLKKSKIEHELIIVDDASTDDSQNVIAELAMLDNKRIKTFFKEKNEGFPATTHLGFKNAVGEIVFVIKNDSVPSGADHFSLMLQHFKDPEVFAVVAALHSREGEKKEVRGQGRIVFFRGMFLHFRRKDEYEKWLETTRYGRKILDRFTSTRSADALLAQDSLTSKEKSYSAWADGGSSAFRRDLYFKIGGFDSVYAPGYWEDTDLGYRAWKAGYKVIYEPKAVLLHDQEQGTYKKKYGAEKIRLINLRNQFIFSWKNSDLKQLFRFFFWETYNHLASLKSGNSDFIRAYWLAVLRLPGIIRSRIYQKGINKLSDDEVLAKFAEMR